MRKLFSILLFVALTASQAQDSQIGWMFINENTISLDKQAHFVGGVWGGVTGYAIAYGANGKRRSNAKVWGIVAATVLGTLKEVSDINTTGFDTADLGYTIAGGVVSTYTFDFLVARAKKRNKKRNKIIATTNNFYNYE